MNASEFIAKWRPTELRERQAAQEHFLDLCMLLGHPTPAEMDPFGERFCFERGASKASGGEGWADVWKQGYFGWEYKGKHKDLAAAYAQLNGYREALENPPLLVVSDIERIEIHTNFTGTSPQVFSITLADLDQPAAMRTLRAVFFDPERLRPFRVDKAVTEQAARCVGELAGALRERGVEPHATARFLDRLVFCMFAEDVGLLPKGVFTRALAVARQGPQRFSAMLAQLFAAMADGGFFGEHEILRFNGNLFAGAEVVELRPDEIALLESVASLDWSEIEPDIFGTLFERGLDPDKRAQIGAHYTSREDIETLVEPVVMAPLRREWEETRTLAVNVLTTGKKRPTGAEKPPAGPAKDKARKEADTLVRNFLDRLAGVKVLDPACGSGNFLYVTLQKLLDLEREALSFAGAHRIAGFLPRVDPRQLHGIEINPYAFELAQMTVWIGYLQWMCQHGAPWPADPVLKPLSTFECKDAILDLSDPAHPKEPDWPAVDYIVSNPPFLGDKLMRAGLGHDYVEELRSLYDGRVPGGADLCCYWFEKSRKQIEGKRCQRAGLLATQGIRGGANRKVLERIKQTGEIFFAESDRPWVLNGANVHVSMVGFDDGSPAERNLDGSLVPRIHSNLTAHADVSGASALSENRGLALLGGFKFGPFEVEEPMALDLVRQTALHALPNSTVIVPWANGADVLRRSGCLWIVDFGPDMGLSEASLFEGPLELVRLRVKPTRDSMRRAHRRERWWLHGESSLALRNTVLRLPRFIATPVLAKYRIFVWLSRPTLPDHQLLLFARSDDYFFGVLHSRVHEVWARAQGTQLRERESGFRYTPTTCFETFPLPWPPGREPAPTDHGPLTTDHVSLIATAAKELDALRTAWLNPPEWTREEILEFPGSADGPWARYVHDPDERGIGTVRWPRLAPRDVECAAKLKARTLTNLYNERPTWLALAHEKLDAAVLVAYGWDPAMSDEQLLESLLALNLARAAAR